MHKTTKNASIHVQKLLRRAITMLLVMGLYVNLFDGWFTLKAERQILLLREPWRRIPQTIC